MVRCGHPLSQHGEVVMTIMMVTTVMTIMMMVLDGDGNRANECGDVDDDIFPSTSIQEGNETANSQNSKVRILRQNELCPPAPPSS